MTTLNDAAAAAARGAGVRAGTDITGFGLLGHLRSMLLASGCAAEVRAAAVPLLPDVRDLAEAGFIPGGTIRNFDSVTPTTAFDPAIDRVGKLILADAQTSGGLLLCVRPEARDALLTGLRQRGTLAAAVVGTVVPGEGGRITVHAT
jgi:selenide,water dikinase